MAVRALGAGQLVDSEGTWPTNYVNFANEEGILDDVNAIYTATATRLQAATIVANSLETTMWAKTGVKSNGEVEWSKTSPAQNILANVLKYTTYKNVRISNTDSKNLKADFASAEFTHTNYDVNARANISEAKYGMDYTILVDTKEQEVLGFWLPTETDSVIFTEIKSFEATGDIKLVVDGKETKFKTNSCAYYENGDDTDTSASFALGVLPISGVAYYGTGANADKIVSIYAEKYTSWGLVKEVSSKKIKFEATSTDFVGASNFTTQITIDEDKDSSYNYKVTKNGKEIAITDIEEGDVVFGYVNPDDSKDYTLNVYNDEVSGKVSSASGSKVTVNGTKYTCVGTASAAAGDEGTFYLAENGKVVMFKAEKTKSDVAMISQMRLVSSTLLDGAAKLEVKYTTMDGVTSDWTEVDFAKSDATEVAKLGNVTRGSESATYTAVGSVVTYEVKSGKFIVKSNTKEAGKYYVEGLTTFTDKAKDVVTLGTTAGTFYLAPGAKAFEKVTYKTDADREKYEVTLKEVNIDDLDTITSGLTGSYVADIDYTQKTVGTLVFAKTNIVADRNWAVVLDVASYSDDDDDTKEDTLVTVLYAGESNSKEFLAEAASITLAKGDVVELAVENDVIKRVTEKLGASGSGELANIFAQSTAAAAYALNDTVSGSIKAGEAIASGAKYVVIDNKAYNASNKFYFAKEYDNETYTLGLYKENVYSTSTASAAEFKETRLAVADDVIVVMIDGSDYKVAKFADINLLDVDGVDVTASTSASDATRINDNNLNGAQSLSSVVTYTDEDGEVSVVAIIYNK